MLFDNQLIIKCKIMSFVDDFHLADIVFPCCEGKIDFLGKVDGMF